MWDERVKTLLLIQEIGTLFRKFQCLIGLVLCVVS